MLMLLDFRRKRAVESLTTDSDLQFASPVYGETLPLEVALVSRSVGTSGFLYTPQSLDGWTLRAGIGKPFQPPSSGFFKITLGSDTTDFIAYNASTATVQTAVNLLASVITAGTVTVTGTVGYYVLTFNAVGNPAQFTVDVSSLAPAPIIAEVGTLIGGSGSIREVQSIRLLQDAAALATIDTTSTDYDLDSEVFEDGGSGANTRLRFYYTRAPYGGWWNAFFTPASGAHSGEFSETALLTWDASAADVQAALEALPGIGAGNIQVVRGTDANGPVWFATFVGDFLGLASASIGALGINPELILGVVTLGGELDLNTPALELLFGSATTLDCIFEIEGIQSGGNPQKLFRQAVTINAPVILPA